MKSTGYVLLAVILVLSVCASYVLVGQQRTISGLKSELARTEKELNTHISSETTVTYSDLKKELDAHIAAETTGTYIVRDPNTGKPICQVLGGRNGFEALMYKTAMAASDFDVELQTAGDYDIDVLKVPYGPSLKEVFDNKPRGFFGGGRK